MHGGALRRPAALVPGHGRRRFLFRVRPERLAGAFVCFTAAWLFESLETWLILSVLDVHASFVTAGSLEVIRGKELSWIAVGYGLLGSDLALLRSRAPRPVTKRSHARA